MAVQLSAYIALRNNDLMRLVETGSCFGGPYISDKDRGKLKSLIDKIDKLNDGEREVNNPNEAFTGPGVAVMITTRIKEKTSHPKETKKLYEGIANILKRSSVRKNFYAGLGDMFDELDLRPSKDTMAVIEYARGPRFSFTHEDPYETMCWKDVKDRKKRGV